MAEHNVLIVEDELLIAAELKDIVTALGYAVCATTDSGEEAIRVAQEKQPSVALMDITLVGEMDGIEAAQKLRERFQIPVVFITAHSDPEILQRAKVTKPYGYIIKPFQEIEIRVALEIALHNHYTRETFTDIEKRFDSVTHTNASQVFDSLSTMSFFREVPSSTLQNFTENLDCRSLSPGDFLCYEEDLFEHGILVVSGRIALLKISASGRELITDLLLPKSFFGLSLALEDGGSSLNVRAQVKSEVYLVPKKSLINLFDSCPALYRPFIAEISDRLQRSHSLSRALAHDRIEVRVASALISLSEDLKRSSGISASSQVPITRQELASLTGTTVETAIRVTKSLERENILDLAQQGCIMLRDVAQLSEIAQIDS